LAKLEHITPEAGIKGILPEGLVTQLLQLCSRLLHNQVHFIQNSQAERSRGAPISGKETDVAEK
jgi:hypothetical protein